MKLFVLLLLAYFSAGTTATSDKKCGTDLSNLWLDVIIVADQSIGMTSDKMHQARDTIIGTFENETRIGTKSYTDPRTTRVGIITYAETPTLQASLDQFQSYKDLVKTVNSVFDAAGKGNASFMGPALSMAEDMFNDEETARGNFPKLLIVLASSLTDDTLDEAEEIAGRMRYNGVTIATVAYQHDEQFHRYMSLISSNGYNYTHNSHHVVESLQHAATDANCICPPGYSSLGLQRVESVMSDPKSTKYAQCAWSYDTSLNWANAKLKCQNDVKNGYLATEFSKQKHEWLDSFVRFRYKSRHDFFNGLHYVNGGWFWEQPVGMPLVALNGFSGWDKGFPKSSSTNVVVTNVESESYETAWQNTNTLYKDTHHFVCQVAACDTDHFCK